MKGLTRSQWFLLLLFAGVMFVIGIRALNESDIFYHVKAGEVIWQTKSIPTTDIFSSSAAGARWVTHEWLPELIFFCVYSLAGFWGLIALVGFCVAVISYLLVLIAFKRGANLSVAVIITFICTLFSLPYWKARPQIFGYLAFVVLVALLEHYRKHNNVRTLWLACGVMVLWANFSASFLLGAVVFLYYGISVWIQSYFTRALTTERHAAQRMLVASIIGTALGLFNPNTYALFTYPMVIAPAVAVFNILEWRSILSFLSFLETRLQLAMLALSDVFLAWWFVVRAKSRDVIIFGLVAGISILPFISSRHIIFWFLLASILLPAALSEVLKEKLAHIHTKLTWLLVVLFAGIGMVRLISLPARYYDPFLVPVRAADFIQEQQIKGPIFNLYNEGGYLMFRFWPQERVFIDGRSEVFLGKPIEEYLSIIGATGEWRKLIDDTYKVQYMVLPYWPSELAHTIAPLTNELLADKEWSLVYWDDATTIYVRDSTANGPLVSRYGAHIITPFKNPKDIKGADVKAARDEIMAFAKRTPDSAFIAQYAHEFFISHAETLKKLNK